MYRATRRDYATGESRHLQKILKVLLSGFFHLCPKDTTSFAWHTQHHLSVSSTSFRRRRTQMNDVALRANDVLRNDVGLRPTMLRFAQTEFFPLVS